MWHLCGPDLVGARMMVAGTLNIIKDNQGVIRILSWSWNSRDSNPDFWEIF